MSFTTRRLREKEPARLPWTQLAFFALKIGGPLLAAARVWRKEREKRIQQERRVHLLQRILIILFALFCAALLFAGAARALGGLKILSLSRIASVAGTPLPSDTYGHTNILLLGQGDASHEGVDLTDTIMLASLDPTQTKSTVLLSLPRDLYFLSTEHMGEGRINSLYRDYKIALKRDGQSEAVASENAMKELAKEIGKHLNVEIHHVIKVDFIGFIQAVDAIGGLDIVVPESLVDPEYPGPNYTYETFQINAGPQHLDGETALKYARSRHSTSDFDRSKRQQQILRAMAEKIRSEHLLTKPGQIMELLGILNEHVATTLTLRDMVSLAQAGKEMDTTQILSMQLNSQNGLYGALSSPGGFLYNPPRDAFGGASVLLPVSVPEFPVTWKQIEALTTLLVHVRTPYLERLPIRILNAGAKPGSARRLAGELIRYGFDVRDIENAPDRNQPQSSVEAPPESESGLLLARLLGVPLSPLSPSAPQVVTIALGEDFAFTSLQQLLAPSPAEAL